MKNKKKIVHLAKGLDGGAGIATKRIHLFLKKNNYESIIIKQDNISASKFKKIKNFLKSCKIFYNFYLRVNKYCFSFLYQKKNKKLIDEVFKINKIKKIDCIFIHWIDGFVSSEDLIILKKNLDAEFYLVLHDMYHLTGGCHYSYECKNYKLNCKNCPGVPIFLENKVNTNYISKLNAYKIINPKLLVFSKNDYLLSKKSKLNFKNIFYLNYPLDLNIFNYQGNKALKKNYQILTSVIKYDPRKGYYIFKKFLEILELHLRKINIKIDIFVYDKKLFKQKYKNINFIYFKFKKNDKELSNLYKKLDLYINFSNADAAPLSIVENLHCGVPIVSANIGNSRDHINDYKNGIIIDKYDAELFVKILIKILLKKIKFYNKKKIRRIQKNSLIKENRKFLKVLNDKF